MADHPGKPDDKPNPREFVIHVDAAQFKVADTTMNGAQIKALAGKDPQYQLFLEKKGNDPDQLIADTYSVVIENGQHFYTVPPATFGANLWGS